MAHDLHQTGSCYEIRSVYFDDLWNSCMDENDAGVDDRQKYRIRTYGAISSPIKLEIKEKRRGLTKKTACILSQLELESLLGAHQNLPFGGRAPLNKLMTLVRLQQMAPKIIIVYERTAFVHPSGNVRITFDRNITASTALDSFQSNRVKDCIPILPTGMHVLEVKYDEFLPDIISRQLEIGSLQQTAFSKYYLGRQAVNGAFPIVR